MAYKGSFDPDALPAHAQPHEVAAMMAQSQRPPGSYGGPPPPAGSARPDPYANKPQPPPPHPQQAPGSWVDNGYGHRKSSNASIQSGGPSGSYNGHKNRPPPPPAQGRNRYGSPPPQNYGTGPPPQSYHGRPAVPNRVPASSPGPPRQGGDRDSLWPIFRAVDNDGNGHLTENELRTALVNGDWTAFDMHTVRMMMRMFDTDRSGAITFDEFCGLWGFLIAWRNLFDRFDTDRSGSIQYHEFSDALVAFGYRLSPQFVQLLYRTYDRRGDNRLSFDLFVQACISLKRMTDVFKKYDEDRDGYITLSFEEFLTGAQSLFLFNSISPNTDVGLF